MIIAAHSLPLKIIDESNSKTEIKGYYPFENLVKNKLCSIKNN